MDTETPDLTKTERNLWNAIVGEAMAYLKYNAFAHKALEEGHPEVAQVFQEVAGAETIHGMNHLRVAGEIKSTIDNLRNVTEGETKEFSFMYPRMIRDAQDENRPDAVSSFTLALEREKHHLEVFTRALEQLEALQITVDESANQIQQYNEKRPDPATEVPTPTSETYISATREVDRERFRVANLGRLREVVFGAQDGILSTVALVTAVAVGVGASGTSTVLVAGLAAALAGMISMATGAYLGSRAEQDVQRSEIAREARELEENPAEELAELVVIFQREGKTFAEAQALAEDISQDKDLWLNTLVEKELGISTEETTNPIKDGLVMGASFIIAALIPILPYLFFKGTAAISISIIGALTGLFVLGMGKGRLVQRSPLLQGLEILAIGAVSAGLGFVLGDLIPRVIN
ncbi:MAG: VIT1/CCC1 transporter family protein [Chloroflexota bacterium]|nr:VIT1/CCC1 transporter family protein [Chloroflexota bacterium]